MPPPHRAEALSDDACLTSDVCLSRTLGLSREQRPRKTKIDTEVSHITRDSDTTFKVKRSTCRGGILWRPPTQLVHNSYWVTTGPSIVSRLRKTLKLYRPWKSCWKISQRSSKSLNLSSVSDAVRKVTNCRSFSKLWLYVQQGLLLLHGHATEKSLNFVFKIELKPWD